MMLEILGRALARYLSKPRERGARVATTRPETLAATLKKGDVLLIEGNTRISVAIKYLTQSSWSHATLFVGDAFDPPTTGDEAKVLVEADVVEGVRAIPLRTYSALNTRICRPVGLSPEEIDKVVAYALSRVGHRYDLKHVVDLMRYVIHTPPVTSRWRRRLLALGSGDPTRAICSSLIAKAFEVVRYPILPEVKSGPSRDPACPGCVAELLHVRHHSLFVPRDFDVSPYFDVVKPAL